MLGFLRPTARRRARSKGAAAVEFALIMPIFVAILCGMIDWSYYFYQRYALSVAVREGIRVGVAVLTTATPDSWNTAQTRAANVLTAGGALDPTQVTWGPSSGSRYNGAPPTETMTLSASYTYKPLIGFVGLGTKTMSYSMTMMLELDN
jgi:Flp pilus assembly protein TadG